MASRQSSRRAWLAARGLRVAALAALLGSGVLAAAVLASSHPARAESKVSTTTNAGPPAVKGAWMTFEANPVSFALRPLRRFAVCVRRHGVPGLADPKVVDGKVLLMLPPGLTAKSPRLRKARQACRRLLPQGADSQPGTDTGPTTTRPGGR